MTVTGFGCSSTRHSVSFHTLESSEARGDNRTAGRFIEPQSTQNSQRKARRSPFWDAVVDRISPERHCRG